MRRFAAGLFALTLLSAAAWAWRSQQSPVRGALTLMRDEGGCIVGLNDGVRLVWDETGATLAPVSDRMVADDGPLLGRMERTVGLAQPFPLERARALARRFGAAADASEPSLRSFRQRTMEVQLAGNAAARTLDCRADYGGALKTEAELNGGAWDWVRYGAYRAKLWTPPCEAVDPLLTELLAAR